MATLIKKTIFSYEDFTKSAGTFKQNEQKIDELFPQSTSIGDIEAIGDKLSNVSDTIKKLLIHEIKEIEENGPEGKDQPSLEDLKTALKNYK